MWPVDRFTSLLMGEIKRLADTPDGYGPNGKNFLAHIDILADVQQAYQYLLSRNYTPR